MLYSLLSTLNTIQAQFALVDIDTDLSMDIITRLHVFSYNLVVSCQNYIGKLYDKEAQKRQNFQKIYKEIYKELMLIHIYF
jgi:hypothetical protein